MKIENILKIFHHVGIDADIYDDDNNEIIIYDVDDYDVDEIIDDVLFDLYDYQIIRYDADYHEIYIKFDLSADKKYIDSNQDLKKFLFESYKYNELLDADPTYKNIYDKSIGMNKLSDYCMKFYQENKTIFSFELSDDDKFDDTFYYDLMNLLSYDISSVIDADVYDDLYEFDKNDEIDDYNNYDVFLTSDKYIIVNYTDESIYNITDELLYDLFIKLFDDIIGLSKKIINYDKLIDILNLISYDYKIIYHDDILFKIDIDYNEFIDDYPDYDEFIDEFKINYDNHELNNYNVSSIKLIDIIDYDELFDLFEFDDLYFFMLNNLDESDNYIRLSNIIYNNILRC